MIMVRHPSRICRMQPRQYSGKFISLRAYINKSERTRVNELGMQIKKLESEQIKNPQMKTKLEIIKIKGEINTIESGINK